MPNPGGSEAPCGMHMHPCRGRLACHTICLNTRYSLCYTRESHTTACSGNQGIGVATQVWCLYSPRLPISVATTCDVSQREIHNNCPCGAIENLPSSLFSTQSTADSNDCCTSVAAMLDVNRVTPRHRLEPASPFCDWFL